jgi:hypothetical protein
MPANSGASGLNRDESRRDKLISLAIREGHRRGTHKVDMPHPFVLDQLLGDAGSPIAVCMDNVQTARWQAGVGEKLPP